MVWIGFFITLIGLVPTVGSVIKGILKLLLKNTEKILKEIIQVFNYFLKGNAIHWLKKLQSDMGKHADDAAKIGIDIFNAIISKLKEVKEYIPGFMKHTHQMIKDWIETLSILKRKINGQFAEIGDDFAGRIGRVLAKRADNMEKGSTRTLVSRTQLNKEPPLENKALKDIRKLNYDEAREGLIKHSGKEAEGFARRLAELMTKEIDPADRVVLGRWNKGVDDYHHDAHKFGGTIYNPPGPFYSGLREELGRAGAKEKSWLVNQQFLQIQLEKGVKKIDVFKETILEILTLRPDSVSAREMEFLATNAKKYGYDMLENGKGWVKR